MAKGSLNVLFCDFVEVDPPMLLLFGDVQSAA